MLAFIALLALPALATAYPQILPSGSGAGNFQYQQVSNFGNCVQQQWAGGQQIHCLPQTFQGVGNQGNCNQDLYNQLQGFSNEISYCNPQLNGNGQFQYQSVNNYGNCLQQELRGGASIDCLPSAFPASSVGCTQNIFGQLQAFNNELPVCGQGYVSQQGFQGFGFPSQGGVTTGPGFGSTGSGFGGNQGFGGQGGWRGVPNYRRCMLAQQNANNVYGLCLPNQIADTEVCSQETYNQLQSFKETITQCDDSLGSAPFSGVEGHLNCLQEEQRGGVSALCLPNQIVDSESCSEETFGRLKEFRTQITECSNANGSPAGTRTFEYQSVNGFSSCVGTQFVGGASTHCLPQSFEAVGDQTCSVESYNQLQQFDNELAFCDNVYTGTGGQFQYQSLPNFGSCLQQEFRGGANVHCVPAFIPGNDLCALEVFERLQELDFELPQCGQGFVGR